MVVPAAYVYLLREGECGAEVLLQLRQNTGFMDGHWAAAAAGHIDAGESAEAAARREAAEELGLDAATLTFATVLQRHHSSAPIDQRFDVFFTAREWSGEPKIMEPRKCAELRWWPLTALPTPIPAHERFVLDGLATGALAPFSSLGFVRPRAR